MRIPMMSGSRVVVVNAPEDAVVLRPPLPQEIADVAAAVRDSLRFPLSGGPLEALATRGGTATLVVEPAALPLPGAPADPRQAALGATIGELERLGIPSRRQTILVAGGLSRRAGTRELESLLSPTSARAFRGRVDVHDVESEELVPLGDAGGVGEVVGPDAALGVLGPPADLLVEQRAHAGPALGSDFAPSTNPRDVQSNGPNGIVLE